MQKATRAMFLIKRVLRPHTQIIELLAKTCPAIFPLT